MKIGGVKMGTKIIKGENYNIPKLEPVNVEEYSRGRTKITHITNRNNNLSNYSKNSRDTYYDTVSRKYKQYKRNPKKTDKNLRRALNHTLRPLLENNFFGGDNEVFITLTYAEPMQEFSKVSTDYSRFWRSLCNYYKHLNLACVYIKEMQEERQSWHIHSLIKEIEGKRLIIPYNKLYKLWGLGNVWINRVSPIFDNSDYEISIDKEMQHLKFGNVHSYNKVIDYMCKTKSKKGVFPSGAKIHGNKGKLKGPVISVMTYEEVCNTKLKNSRLVLPDTNLIIDDFNNKILNCIQKEYWIEDELNNPNKSN